MASWAPALPGWTIMEWNDENGPYSSKFFRDAVRMRPANASNYCRLWAIYTMGGVYVDNDVEILRPFETHHRAFIGFQRADTFKDSINTAVIGSVKAHPFVRTMLDRIEVMAPDVFPVAPACSMTTAELLRMGLWPDRLNVEQDVGDIHVYSKDAFYPYWHDEQPNSGVPGRTFAIHRWGKSWA